MSVETFFDSHVLLYMFDKASPPKQRTARALVENALRDGNACISYQVVQEVLNVLTGKAAPPISAGEATHLLAFTLEPLWRVQPSADPLRSCLSLQARYGYSFYDSMILAAALAAGCSTLLTEDLQHGQRIEGLTIRNPFRP